MRRALVWFAILMIAPTASATVLIPAEFREIVAGSEIIVHARVVDIRPEWVDGRRQIESIVTAEILSSFKGASEGTIRFKIPGGEIGIYRSVTIGAPSFKRGDEAVLFLSTIGTDVPYVFGLNQGVFRVRQDQMTGRRVVVTPALMASGSSPELVRRGSANRRPIELDAFGAQVRAVMAERGGAK